jgi:hypothetical protein
MLKMNGLEAEHVAEYVKGWTWIGKSPTSRDQTYIFCKQMHREDVILRSSPGVMVVSESPLLLSSCYAKLNKTPGHEYLMELSREFDESFPTLNLFVDRGELEYRQLGRFEDQRGAKEVDEFILSFMDNENVKYETIRYDDLGDMAKIVGSAIGKKIEIPLVA